MITGRVFGRTPFAVRAHVVAGDAGHQSVSEGEFGRYSLRHCRTWRQVHRVDLATGEPPIMARFAQLRHIPVEAQTTTCGRCMADCAPRGVAMWILDGRASLRGIAARSDRSGDEYHEQCQNYPEAAS